MTEGLPLEAKKTFWEVLTSEKYFKWALIVPLLMVLAVFMFYPLFYSLFYSTQTYTARAPAVFVGWENYRAVLHSRAFWGATGLTFYVLVICIAVELTLGMAIAFLFDRKFRGQNVIRGLCLLPLLIAPLAMSQMWENMLRTAGIVNVALSWVGISPIDWFSGAMALNSIMIMNIWQWLPFSIFVLFAGLRGLPRDTFEAARIDGASAWYTFRRLTLPMLTPLILIIVLLRTMWLIRIFDPLFGTTRGGAGTETLDWYLYRINFYYFNIGQGTTMGIIALFMTIILCAILFRQLIMTLGPAK